MASVFSAPLRFEFGIAGDETAALLFNSDAAAGRGRGMPVQDVYDVTKSLVSGKALEGMIAYAGLTALVGEGAADRADGVLKIAAFSRPSGDGYLTLTFVLDVEGDKDRRAALQSLFRRLEQSDLAEPLGTDFDMLLRVPLSPFADSKQFLIEELNLYFRRLASNERMHLEQRVLPLLSAQFGFVLEPLDWLEEARQVSSGAEIAAPSASDSSLRQWLRHWLGVAARQPSPDA
ncbi:hypothetical protein [Thiohalocapsa marina]|uniref:hypothetical protein n=1 Tax=Thiohalocapsa marina TaxID=424902 RepID=UPI0036D88581